MKKFQFTLQPVYDYKQTVEKLQKAELSKAQQALRELQDEERRLIEAREAAERTLEQALERNENVTKALAEHDAYFMYLRDALKKLRQKLAKAEDFKNKCEANLIRTMKEIKTYDKLRDEQYQTYQKEVQAEDDKNMGDLVSFKFINNDTG